MDHDTLSLAAAVPRQDFGSSQTAGEAARWQTLATAQSDRQAFVQNWLAIQSGFIRDTLLACVVLQHGQGYKPVAIWPETSSRENLQKELHKVAEAALQQQKSVALRGANGTDVAYPLRHDDQLLGVVALQVRGGDEAYLGQVIQQLQWGSAWLINHLVFHGHSFQQFRERLGFAFKLLTVCLDHPTFKAAAYAVSTELATQLQCDRVSIGFVRHHQVHLQAISHCAQFDAKSSLTAGIAAAMDEAIDQKAIVCFPAGEQPEINHAQQHLATAEGVGSVCTLPLYRQAQQRTEVCGAITLEHSDAAFFGDERVKLCEQIALLLGPLLDTKLREDRWIGRKVLDALHSGLQPLIGPANYRAKMTLAVCTLAALFVSLVHVPYRVSATASIEGWTQRYMSAPIDGYIFDSFVKAGDIVREGQPLFALDNKDLILEKLKWLNKLAQLEKQHVEALVKRDSADAGILRAQINQARAQLDLLEEQLQRTQAVAPFAGIVVKGDLTQKHGAPVKRGETLLQLAPLENYRIILDVAERDIAQVAEGQGGILKLTALSGETFPLEIDAVTPVASSREGKNVFRVEARLRQALADGGNDRLRPGMQGTGKIEVGEASLLWIWTHSMTDWLRVWLWQWWH